MSVKAIPDGFGAVTAHMVVTPADKAIEFYKKAFGAEEIMRMPGPDGTGVMHAEIKIGNSMIMIADEFPGMDYMKAPTSIKGTTICMHLYVEDVDKVAHQAVAAGATVLIPVGDQFYGDRSGRLADPFGHIWIVSTRKEDVSSDEIRERASSFMKQQA